MIVVQCGDDGEVENDTSLIQNDEQLLLHLYKLLGTLPILYSFSYSYSYSHSSFSSMPQLFPHPSF